MKTFFRRLVLLAALVANALPSVQAQVPPQEATAAQAAAGTAGQGYYLSPRRVTSSSSYVLTAGGSTVTGSTTIAAPLIFSATNGAGLQTITFSMATTTFDALQLSYGSTTTNVLTINSTLANGLSAIDFTKPGSGATTDYGAIGAGASGAFAAPYADAFWLEACIYPADGVTLPPSLNFIQTGFINGVTQNSLRMGLDRSSVFRLYTFSNSTGVQYSPGGTGTLSLPIGIFTIHGATAPGLDVDLLGSMVVGGSNDAFRGSGFSHGVALYLATPNTTTASGNAPGAAIQMSRNSVFSTVVQLTSSTVTGLQFVDVDHSSAVPIQMAMDGTGLTTIPLLTGTTATHTGVFATTFSGVTLTLSRGTNADFNATLTNTSTAAAAAWHAVSGTGEGYFGALGQSYGGYRSLAASNAYMFSPQNIAIQSDGGTIKFGLSNIATVTMSTTTVTIQQALNVAGQFTASSTAGFLGATTFASSITTTGAANIVGYARFGGANSTTISLIAAGTATLSSGTVSVSAPGCLPTTKIFVNRISTNGSLVLGVPLTVSTTSSFTITAEGVTTGTILVGDVSVFDWEMHGQ